MGTEDVALDVAFSPDGKLLTAGGMGGVNLWSVASRKRVHALDGSGPVAFFRDGTHLATLDMSRGGRNRVVMWTLRPSRPTPPRPMLATEDGSGSQAAPRAW